ncbi:MAG: hypothetical protein EBT92_18770 [Planctomycetes bacterium]|nr:hypothetical protein [Planctomycetota bacterium]
MMHILNSWEVLEARNEFTLPNLLQPQLFHNILQAVTQNGHRESYTTHKKTGHRIDKSSSLD